MTGSSQTQAGSGLLQQLHLSRLPDRGSQLQANDFFFFAAPETGHQKDASANTGITQGNGFIQRSNAEPARSFLLQRLGTLRGAVAIGVRLHHRADGDARYRYALDDAEVVAQVLQRHLGPGRSRRRTLQDFSCSH